MSDFEPSAVSPDLIIEPAAPMAEDDVPARRLLAHEVEHDAWDHDGEDASPPPD